MAKLETGILGVTTGKVGPVICQRWKTINLVKQYTKPTDAKSPAQLIMRDKMSFLSNYSRVNLQNSILIGFLNYCVEKPLAPVHAFFKFNMVIDDPQNNEEKLQFSHGDLKVPEIITCRTTGIDTNLLLTWNTDQDSTSKPNDLITIWLRRAGTYVLNKISPAGLIRSEGEFPSWAFSPKVSIGDYIYITASNSNQEISNTDGARVISYVP